MLFSLFSWAAHQVVLNTPPHAWHYEALSTASAGHSLPPLALHYHTETNFAIVVFQLHNRKGGVCRIYPAKYCCQVQMKSHTEWPVKSCCPVSWLPFLTFLVCFPTTNSSPVEMSLTHSPRASETPNVCVSLLHWGTVTQYGANNNKIRFQ